VAGLVQGVGFRPHVYALAVELGLSGSVGNTAGGVVVEVEGPAAVLDAFTRRLAERAPALARIESVVSRELDPVGGTGFTIAASRGGSTRTLVSPDVATCDDCVAELSDPTDRRYRHQFISCTNCGPRFTVVLDLPYDRPATTMAPLPLCQACAAEYGDPTDRRFHAQTVACRDCGPVLTLRQPGLSDVSGDEAVAAARAMLRSGAIVAIKGIGGYHLACDAADRAAVVTLRKRKDRGDKPFAVMVVDLAAAEHVAALDDPARRLLNDPRRPIVLVPARAHSPLAGEVAPHSPDVGLVLAYTPLHRLLFGLPGDPPGPSALVMTSGNRSCEPIVTDDAQALTRLAGLADAWLMHDRAIVVPCDDSVVRLALGTELPLRRSRGWAPLPIALPVRVQPALALGGDLKNTVVVGRDGYAWLSAHIGDMDDLATLNTLGPASTHLAALTGVEPRLLITDKHPGYRSAAWATRNAAGRQVRRVQHHHAHLASVMAENGHDGSRPVLGFAFDGTGYGDDGAVWGGEVLLADYARYTRLAHLKYVPLPGGDGGVRNPCRMALAHLRAAGLPWDPALPSVAACSPTELAVLARQLDRGLACVPTSSMGRLFDAVCSLIGVCHRIDYEAEAAMRLEGLARSGLAAGVGTGYRFGDEFDPAPVLAAVCADVLRGAPAEVVAARFHLAVAAVVRRIADGAPEVALSGGVFGNVVLTELCTRALQQDGCTVLRHRLVPPGDGGLALGQLVVAARVAPEQIGPEQIGPEQIGPEQVG
jgi:hydrogenase maturation protein HypF